MEFSRFLIVILITLLVSSCSPKEGSRENENPAQRIISAHAEKQMKKYKLELAASDSSPSSAEASFVLHYNTSKKVQLNEARKLFVLSVEEFLNMANANEELRPSLEHYPLSVNDLHFNMGFVNMYGEFYEPPNVSYIYLNDGNIVYCYYDNLFATFTDYEDVEEPYSEALEIVTSGNQPPIQK